MTGQDALGRRSARDRALYDAHRAVLAFLRRRAGDLSEADREDLASSAIEMLLEKERDEEIVDMTAYAIAIAHGKLANAIQKRKRREDADVSTLTAHRTAEDLVIAAEDAIQAEVSIEPEVLDPEAQAHFRRQLAGRRVRILALVFATWGMDLADEGKPLAARNVLALRVNEIWEQVFGDRDVAKRFSLMTALEIASKAESDDSAASLARDVFAQLGYDDFAALVPDEPLRVALAAWRRRAGERGGMKKFDGVSGLLKQLGDEDQGASPEALKKLWQRMMHPASSKAN